MDFIGDCPKKRWVSQLKTSIGDFHWDFPMIFPWVFQMFPLFHGIYVPIVSLDFPGCSYDVPICFPYVPIVSWDFNELSYDLPISVQYFPMFPHMFSYVQWQFQEPKLEVPTISKAYFSGLCKGIPPQKMAWKMVQYFHFRILKISHWYVPLFFQMFPYLPWIFP